MTPKQVWIAWFIALTLPGTLMLVGLQSALQLPLGYAFATQFFVVLVAVAIADIQEYLCESVEDPETMTQEEIDEELNGTSK